MRISPFITVLDACVLAPMPVVDTLLRLAEEPAFYTPKWSPHILAEVERTLKSGFRYSETAVQRRIQAMKCTFPDAMVNGYEALIPSMTNHERDRHVLAAAVKCGAQHYTAGPTRLSAIM